jgi:hypothetical protein
MWLMCPFCPFWRLDVSVVHSVSCRRGREEEEDVDIDPRGRGGAEEIATKPDQVTLPAAPPQHSPPAAAAAVPADPVCSVFAAAGHAISARLWPLVSPTMIGWAASGMHIRTLTSSS